MKGNISYICFENKTGSKQKREIIGLGLNESLEIDFLVKEFSSEFSRLKKLP